MPKQKITIHGKGLRPRHIVDRSAEAIVKGYRDGLSTYQLGREYGVSYKTIERFLHTKGVTLRSGNRKLTEQAVRKIRTLHAAGFNQTKIGEAAGCDHSNIHCVVRYKSWRSVS